MLILPLILMKVMYCFLLTKEIPYKKVKPNPNSEEPDKMCERVEENTLLKTDIKNIDRGHIKPKIISQETLMRPYVKKNVKEKTIIHKPLQNITNKLSLQESRNLVEKQNYTMKTPQRQTKQLNNQRGNEEENAFVYTAESANPGINAQEADSVNDRSLKYTKNLKELKKEITDLSKQVQDKCKECDDLENLVMQKDNEINRMR